MSDLGTLVCPKCGGTMTSYERSGVTVDACRQCRGIFLDRNELERLIDAEGSYYQGPHDRGAPYPPAGCQRHHDDWHERHHGYERHHDDDDDDDWYDRRHGHDKHRRRGGFLSELFD